MNRNAQLVGVCFDDRECTNPLACCWVLPVLPQTADPKVATVLHGDGMLFPCGRPSLVASRDVPAARRGPRMRLSRNGLAPSVRLVLHWNIARCAGECAAVQEIAEWLEKLGMSEYAEDARAPLPTNRV